MRSFFFIFLFCFGCAPFRNSPFSDQVLRTERNLNEAKLEKLRPIEQDGKIRIAVFSDSHQNYKDLDQAVIQINKTADVDFVVNLGDVTNSGYNFEYDQFLDTYILIQRPVFSVIGNHDAIGAGIEIFNKLLGSSNFWFESNTRRFVFFNSVNLEDPAGFNPAWLRATVESSAKPVIIFSHVHLRDPDRFFGVDAQNLGAVIENPRTQMILNGHNHSYELSQDHGTVMLQCPRVENVQWLLIEIQGNQAKIQLMNTGGQVWENLKN